MATSQRQQPRQQGRSSSAAQVGLVVLMAADLDKAASLLDPADMTNSLRLFVRVVHAIVVKYSRMSVSLAVRQYELARHDAGLVGGPSPKVPPDPSLAQVEALVEQAVGALPSAPVEPTPAELEAAEKAVVDAAEDIVLEAGRTTTLETLFTDQEALGWARVPEPDCCAFCALLAIRGAVYKADSFVRSTARFAGPGRFKVHDECRCDMEPVFTAYEPSALVRQWKALYRDLPSGLSGTKAVLKAWRHAFREHAAGKAKQPA